MPRVRQNLLWMKLRAGSRHWNLKGESEAYLEELNAQLTDLKNSLEELQQQSADKQAELEKVQAELEKAKDQEKEQYEDMCLRIQYMYEQSNSGYLEVLFDSGSFSEFLNRAGNISQITQYDRDMLDEYQATKHTIAEHENDKRGKGRDRTAPQKAKPSRIR